MTILELFLGLFSLFSPSKPAEPIAKRALDFTTGGRRGKGWGTVANINSDILNARGLGPGRARYGAYNQPLVASCVSAFVSNMIGTGIRIVPATGNPDLDKIFSQRFEDWTDNCDFFGRQTFYGMQSTMASRYYVDGEAIALRVFDGDTLKIKLIDPAQIDGTANIEQPDGGVAIAGVVLDAEGRPVAYDFYRNYIAGLPLLQSLERVRIPAEDVLHFFRVETAGQVRGLSHLSASLLRANEHDGYSDAQLLRMRTGAMLCGFVTDSDGTLLADGTTPGEASLEPGTIQRLRPGESYTASEPTKIGPEVVDHERGVIREISAGAGLPSFLVDYDLSQVNFSSARTPTMAPQPTPTNAPPAAPTPTPTPDPPITDRAAVNAEIRSIARLSGLQQAWIDTQIDNAVPIDQVRAAALEAMRTRSAAAATIRTATASITGFDANDPAFRSRAIGEALATRLTGQAPPEQARDFVGLTSVELCRELLRTSGLSTMGSPGVIVERAMTTSDLPSLMGDAVNRSMRLAYQAVPSALKLVARQRTASDFRKLYRIQLSAAPTLEKVLESGEFVHGAVTDSSESFRLETFGRIISLSRQVLINDDLAALSDLTRRMGIAAAAFEAQSLVDMLQSPPVMSDGYAVFSTNHSNLASPTDAAPSDTTLAAARLAMRKQTDPSGMLIAATPRYLLVPSDLETAAQKLLTSIQAVETSNVNPWSFLQLIVEPRLSDAKKWWLIADPAAIDGLEFAYLAGEEGPQTFSEIGFDVDGIKYKIREDFGCGWSEARGWYCNPGQ